MDETIIKCNRCGDNVKNGVCESCRRNDAIYCFCDNCGRYAMHYRGDKICVVCSSKEKIKNMVGSWKELQPEKCLTTI